MEKIIDGHITKLCNEINGESTKLAARTHRKLDLIHSLPGQPKQRPGFKQYGGYVTVDVSSGRSLYYYFAEAATKPDSKPLILWLNGGHGCSSLLGAMVEIGPFGVNPDGKSLYRRRFAWNKVANTLFLESPAGVGFSYSNSSADYKKSGDKRTAEDAYAFLLKWFERFPHYKKHDFYIAGESYAGHYIPELMDVILEKNAIRVKGIMIGNGIINQATDDKGVIDFLWTHALISDEVYQQLRKNGSSPAFDLGKIDQYNIYAPLCNSSRSGKARRPQMAYDPCELDYIGSYLNLPVVQEALHANRTKLPYTWEICSSLVGSNWDFKHTPSTMFPIYRRLMSSRLRILLYSGDVDSVVPVTSTRYSIAAMGLRVKKPWSPWYGGDSDEQRWELTADWPGLLGNMGLKHTATMMWLDRGLAQLTGSLVANCWPAGVG
ncbi:hypothetical protein DH2020_034353 [Rehmannia glutinosa]|uniref:Carboxypeptidase n=1 Tax=Rehmannia glutinosa TaxID=99300 RepID=A0ABR0VA44_REHGL